MRELTNDERNLLRHYAEQDRLIRGPQRTPIHQHLLRIGFIEEKPVNLRELGDTCHGCWSKGLGIHIMSAMRPCLSSREKENRISINPMRGGGHLFVPRKA